MQQLQKYKKTEIGELPKEWDIKSVLELSQVVTIGVVNVATSSYTSKENGIPYFRTQNVRENQLTDLNLVYVTSEFNKKHKKSILQEDDVLTVQTGDIGTSCLVPKKFEGCNCHSIIVTRTDKNKLVPQFFCQLLNSIVGKNIISRFALDTGRGHLLLEDFRNLKIPHPSLREQQKIASILSKVDNLIEKIAQIIAQTQRLKKGLMQRLLTKGIGHTKFKKINFSSLNLDIPENWECVRMKTLCLLSNDAILTGPFGLMLHSSDYVKEGTPLILIKNIQNGRIDDSEIPKISEKDVERLARYKVRKGDIVFSRVGRVGSAALIEDKHNGWLISGQTLRIRFNNPDVNPQFVNYFIELNIFQKILKSGMLGSTRDSINTTILENSPVLLPSINEQNRIVVRIIKIDIALEMKEKILLRLQNLKNGLMQQLLTGKIRVKI